MNCLACCFSDPPLCFPAVFTCALTRYRSISSLVSAFIVKTSCYLRGHFTHPQQPDRISPLPHHRQWCAKVAVPDQPTTIWSNLTFIDINSTFIKCVVPVEISNNISELQILTCRCSPFGQISIYQGCERDVRRVHLQWLDVLKYPAIDVKEKPHTRF